MKLSDKIVLAMAIITLIVFALWPTPKISKSIIKPKSQYLTVELMECEPANKVYSKKQLKNISKFDRTLPRCGIVFSDVRIKKDLISMYRIHYSELFVSDEYEGALSIEKYNIEHCIIYTAKNPKGLHINAKCRDLDKELL